MEHFPTALALRRPKAWRSVRWQLLQGARLYWQQWYGLFLKRMLSARRDRLALVTQLLVPIALVLVALWARQATDAFPQEPALGISRCDILPLLCCMRRCGCAGVASCLHEDADILMQTVHVWTTRSRHRCLCISGHPTVRMLLTTVVNVDARAWCRSHARLASHPT